MINVLLANRWVRAALVLGVFVLTFLLSFALLFPYETLANAIEAQVDKNQAPLRSRGQRYVDVEIGDLGPRLLLGANLDDVTVRIINPAADDRPNAKIPLEELGIGVSILSLLASTVDLDVDASLLGGKTTAAASFKDGIVGELEIDAKNIRLGRTQALAHFLGLPGGGTLDAKLDIDAPTGTRSIEGPIEITLKNVWLGDGESKLSLPGMQDGLTLERLNLKTLTIVAEAKNGVIEIKRLEAPGPDLTLEAKGSITLGRTLRQTQTNLMVRFRVEPAYLERDTKIEALLSLADFDPKLQAAKTDDGFFQYRLTGALTNLRNAAPAGKIPF